MQIHFYLNNEEQDEIAIFYNLVSNPFKVDDIINLNVSEFSVNEFKLSVNPDKVQSFKDSNKELTKKFHMREVRIVKENKYMQLKTVAETKLTIEYFCEIL